MTLWFISDTHFGHTSMVEKFVLSDGSPARPFSSVEEMDELMIRNWNDKIRQSDHVYHLGDVAMKRQDVDRIMPRLNGHKRLVRGNHDIFKTKLYMKYFEEIYGVRVIDRMIFTHIPIAPWCMGRFSVNVHGHVHTSQSRVMRFNKPAAQHIPDGVAKECVYVNLSVEAINYTPVSLEEIKSWL